MTAEKRQQPKPVRVSIVEDDRITRESVADLVRRAAGLELVAAYPDAETALHAIPADPPDVVVMDLNLAPPGSGRLDGAACVAALAAAAPGVQVLMLTVYDDERVFEALRAGASGYILKDVRGSDIVESVRRVAAGGTLLEPSAVARARDRLRRGAEEDARLKGLTPQEHRILALLAEGRTNRQIAEEMYLAEKTVKNYVSNLLSKMGMSRRTEAAVYAARLAERARNDR